MKIQSSTVAMNSNRVYNSFSYTKVGSEERKFVPNSTKPNENDSLEKENGLSKFINEAKKLLDDQASQAPGTNPAQQNQNKNQLQSSGSTVKDQALSSAEDFSDPLKGLEQSLQTLRKMLDMLFNRKSSSASSISFSSSTSMQQSMSIFLTGSSTQPIPLSPGTWVKNVEGTHFFSEQESTSFSSVGIAKTEDGREIAFGVSMEMSRSFMQSTSVSWTEEVVMTDPLVINFKGDPANLSDQKFTFDIDADGKEDNISYLNKNSGYLALDKNNDGKINDGNELFGAKTGNGFEELSAYDSDKNGWIDENDEIYNKLKVWIKADDGTDKLIDLKSADVGAIYLGNAKTDYTLRSEESGNINGQIRRTGVYLKESTGEAGTMQQIDVSV